MKRTNKFKYNKENTLSRLFAQNRRRNPRHDEDEEEDDRRESHGGAGAAAMGLGAAGLGLAGQGLSALGTVQGVHEQGKGIKGWFDRNKRRKEDYKKFGGDEKLMERKRDQAYRLSKTAKNSQQEAALKHRESEISDSLEWAKKRNNYKRDMAKQTSWAGKGATWAKHNPMKAGLAAAGVAAAAGGAYYMWKKRQEEKKRKQREREAQTRHQSNITSRMFAITSAAARAGRAMKGFKIKPKAIKNFHPGISPNKPKFTPPTKVKSPNSLGDKHWRPDLNAAMKGTAPTKKEFINHKVQKGLESRRRKLNKVKQQNRRLAAENSTNIQTKPDRSAGINARRNNQARKEAMGKAADRRILSKKEKNVRDLAAKTDLQRTSGAGVMGHEYKQARKELKNARIDLHNTKYKDNKLGDLWARKGGLKKFDKNGNLRWGKKRLALAGLGAYAAYNMMKDDDDDK